ncbi:hypothetical protein [Arthrobacter sp. M4]|uniref:MmyB family transcriptional regulator n=1 Tax=Arthrobacter sp. M4 TaxID=218160 RepID=UPI001CDD502E|nr:hypothetical protein [Arthrobacter sp. M4]MCA4131784.1 hypothetical protein [Arthrobacter sp. M4]
MPAAIRGGRARPARRPCSYSTSHSFEIAEAIAEAIKPLGFTGTVTAPDNRPGPPSEDGTVRPLCRDLLGRRRSGPQDCGTRLPAPEEERRQLGGRQPSLQGHRRSRLRLGSWERRRADPCRDRAFDDACRTSSGRRRPDPLLRGHRQCRCPLPHGRQYHQGRKSIHHPVVGTLNLNYETLDLPADGLILFAYSTESGSASEDALRLLANWALGHNPQPAEHHHR